MVQIKPISLRRNFSWTFVGNIVYAASQWGMLVVLAKLGSPEKVGQFTLGLAVTAPVFMLTNLQLRAIQATDAKNEYFFGDYLGLRLIATFLALLIIVGITVTSGYRYEVSLVILAIALSKAIESISDVFFGLIQHHERMDRISISLMIKGILSVLMLGGVFYLTKTVLGGVIGLTVAWLLVLFVYDIASGAMLLNSNHSSESKTENVSKKLELENKLRPRWHLKTLKKLLWLSLPLGLVMMLNSLNINIPRYFIEHYLGEHDLGIFSALSYLMVAGNLVVSALAQSASPRLAKYYAAGNVTAFCNLLIKLLGIGTLVGGTAVVVALVAGRQILTLLYRSEYAQDVDVFIWLMVAAGIGYVASFLGYGITAARYFRIQIPLSLVVTASSAMAGFWLIPSQGLRGAALSLILSSIIQVVISLVVIIQAIYKISGMKE